MYFKFLGIELFCDNEKLDIQRAYAFTSLINDTESPEQTALIDCSALFNGRNISTNYDDMWCTNFMSDDKFCHIVMELQQISEITSKF